MRIRHLIPLLIAAPLSLFALSGCDTTSSLVQLRQVLPQDDPYSITLSGLYRDYAEEQLAAYDWWSSKRFADKGLAAARGEATLPEDPSEWAIPAAAQPEMQDARRALTAALDGPGKQAHPKTAARALFYYDAWIENADEGWREDRIAHYRTRFFSALAQLHPAPTDTNNALHHTPPATPPSPPPAASEQAEPLPVVSSSLVLYFPFDDTTLESQMLPAVEGLIASLKAHPDTQLIINGHADRAGTDSYNLSLSAHRAEYMRTLLITNGIDPKRIEYYAFGESDPAVPTADNIRERANRRVEIFLE